MNGISIVIPNWNGLQTLPAVLQRVYDVMNVLGAPFEVIMVDDASTDSSLDVLHKFPRVRLAISKKNQGFSATANRGVEVARYDLVFLMSNDILIDHSLRAMIGHFDDPSVFAVSPQVRWRSTGTFAYGKRSANWENGYFKVQEHPFIASPVPTLFACGGSAMFRKSIFMELGGFDTLYHPFYWEEIDLGYRAWKRGYRTVHEPRATVYNTDNGVIKSNFKQRYVKLISGRNSYLFLWKNITGASLVRQHLRILAPSLFEDICRNAWRFPLCAIMALFRLPQVLRSRSRERQFQVRSDEQIWSIVAGNECTGSMPSYTVTQQEQTQQQQEQYNESRRNHTGTHGVTAFSG